MLRTINFIAIGVGLILPLAESIQNPFLWAGTTFGLLVTTYVFLDAIPFEENLQIFAFLLTIPWVLYVTGLPTANSSLPMFLGTIFLAVAIPLVMVFLVMQLAQPLEE